MREVRDLEEQVRPGVGGRGETKAGQGTQPLSWSQDRLRKQTQLMAGGSALPLSHALDLEQAGDRL